MIDDPLIGRQLANFRVERVLGRGGMAQVYYGWDVRLERPVALKVIDTRYRAEPLYADRFLREARAVSTWRHENIVQVYYAGEEEGLYYYVMEHLPGRDLSAILAEYAAEQTYMPHEEVLRIGRAIADALDYAHERGVVHRDVKPSNVIVTDDGRVVLTDFGLAMEMGEGSSGEAFGTPRYISPEQARHSADAVPQSDLYSLGVILYEMLTGAVPFYDPSPTSMAIQHMTLPPPPPRTMNPDLNEATEVVLLRALRKRPAERYQSGRELIDDLAEALFGPPKPLVASPPPTMPLLHQRPSLSTVPVVEKVQQVGTMAYSFERPVRETVLWEPEAAVPQQRPVGLLLAGGVALLFLCLLLGAVAAALRLQDDDNRNAILQANSTTPTASPPVAVPVTGAVTPLPNPLYFPFVSLEAGGGQTSPVPTVTLPGGAAGGNRTLHLFYNETSFYAWNPGSDGLAIGQVAFEALDGNGQPAGYELSGRSWAAFFSELQAGRCNRLEILFATAYLRPSQCRGYNATLTPQDNERRVFWIPRDGVNDFRVLWNNQEAGRCPIAAGPQECEIILP